MKKLYLFLFFAFGFFSGFSQTQIMLTFIGKDSLTQNLISFDSVFVKNLTENCDTTLYDAVSILYLDALWPVGISENKVNSSDEFVLKQNYPNPFKGSTIVNLYREYKGQLNLILFDGSGKKLAVYQNELENGFHSFCIFSSGNEVLFLVAFDEKNNRSIKIINSGFSNESNSIRYLGHSPDVNKDNLKIIDNTGFIFYLGNQLMYTAYSNGYNDKIITDSPITSTSYTFLMAPLGNPPTVATTTVTNVTQTTATSGGNVTSDGGYPVITRGVCWSTTPNPTIANSYTVDGSGLGTFVSFLTGLAPNTTYYIRAYATNGVGIGYGNELAFITLQNIFLPVVTTAAVTNITQSSATCGGNVTSDGGSTVTGRGVCWSTSPSPTIANNHTADGSGLGSFISYLTGLSPNTVYYVCAYATNSVGTAYGNENSFTTGQTITTPSVITTAVTNISQTTATSGGNVTLDGGAAVTDRGVCWSTNVNPTVTDNHTTDGSGTGTFISNITGLTGGTLYHVRAYATNSVGLGYGNDLTFTTLTLPTVLTNIVTNISQTTVTSGGNVTSDGGATVTARGVCWSTSTAPTISDQHTLDGSGIGTFVSNITGLTGSTLYHVRAYATNSVGTSYGNELTFTTLNLPTVTTAAVTNIAQTTATSGGNVISDGGAPISVRGVCWSTSPNPVVTGSHTTDGIGTGTFISNITGLVGGTFYFLRAYATNIVGTSYGNELTFTTLDFPSVTTLAVTNITQTSATSGGNVTSDGGSPVVTRGVCWSTSPNPVVTGNHTTDGTGTGSFVSSITGLVGGTIYYVRAYATNSVGTSYGNQLTFTTLNLPSVTTTVITDIYKTTATSGGTVISNGGATVTARGVCWSTSTNPTIIDSHTTDGSGNGVFVSILTGLTPGTLYYVRAYATNSVGTGYGVEFNFYTLGTCGSLTINHVASSVSPVSKTVTYETVKDIPGESLKCWIDSNLGADHQASAVNDASEPSAGWYWQFNRKQGFKHDGIIRTPNTTWISSINENLDWQLTNDPCSIELGGNWRIPTYTEWNNVRVAGNWNNSNDSWISGLKIHSAGNLLGGNLHNRGGEGTYWTCTQYNPINGWDLYTCPNTACNYMNGNNKSNGFTLRCIKD